MNPLNLLPEKFRTSLYVGYALTGLVLGGVLAGYAAINVTPPVAVVAVLAGLNFVGVGLGFTAAANVKVETTGQEWPLYTVPEDDVAGEDEPDTNVTDVEATEDEEVPADDAEPPSTGEGTAADGTVETVARPANVTI